MRTALKTVDGLGIRYAASDGDATETILLTSPWPESVDAFAPIWPLLKCRFRLFAIDLPVVGGAGRGDDLLSPRAMGDFLVRVIDECGLDCPHVVGPGIGTSAALFAAAARPDLVSTVIVGSYVRRSPAELPELAERLPGIDAPVQIVAGAHDRVVPFANAQFLDERLPDSRVTIVDAGHLVWEDAPGEYASIICDWVTQRRSA